MWHDFPLAVLKTLCGTINAAQAYVMLDYAAHVIHK